MLQREEIGDDRLPSSSKMISFELSNHDPHIPATMDDDRYVEYQLDDLVGFPCDTEEEDRMFIEAVIESLKDVELRHPNAGESASSSTVNHQNLTTEDPSPDTNASPVVTPFYNPPSIMISERVSASSRFDTSGSVHGSTDTDFSGNNTKATLIVEQNPANHIMDGLLRRWDFNLFRNAG